MADPLYTVTITITDRVPPLGPQIETKISPEPNPAHHSDAVATWLAMRAAILPHASIENHQGPKHVPHRQVRS